MSKMQSKMHFYRLLCSIIRSFRWPSAHNHTYLVVSSISSHETTDLLLIESLHILCFARIPPSLPESFFTLILIALPHIRVNNQPSKRQFH